MKNTGGIAALIFAALILKNPRQAASFVRNALIMCYDRVIPALFPFMVISEYLSGSPAANLLSMFLRPYRKVMKTEDRLFPSRLLISLTGGFAVGAKNLAAMQKSGYSQKALEVMAPAFINNSFAFCVFAVGVGALKNLNLGLMLFASTALSSLICSFLMSFIKDYNIVKSSVRQKPERVSFPAAITDGVSSILAICGFTVIFYVICQVILLYIKNDIIRALVCILSEISGGIAGISEISGKNPYLYCICLSLLPAGTICQVYHFTGNKGIVKSLVLSRILHLPLSLCIFSVAAHLFPVAAATATSENRVIYAGHSYGRDVSAAMFAVVFLFIAIAGQNNLFTKKE